MKTQLPTVKIDSVNGPFILAIDIGTSSAKILLFDQKGREVEGLNWRKTFEIRTTVDGASESEPDGLLEIVCEGIDWALARAGDLVKDIVAVAPCTFASNIMAVDQKGRPLTPVFTYADTRAENEVEWLKAEFDESAVHDRTGCHFHSCYLPAQLSKFQPEVAGE